MFGCLWRWLTFGGLPLSTDPALLILLISGLVSLNKNRESVNIDGKVHDGRTDGKVPFSRQTPPERWRLNNTFHTSSSLKRHGGSAARGAETPRSAAGHVSWNTTNRQRLRQRLWFNTQQICRAIAVPHLERWGMWSHAALTFHQTPTERFTGFLQMKLQQNSCSVSLTETKTYQQEWPKKQKVWLLLIEMLLFGLFEEWYGKNHKPASWWVPRFPYFTLNDNLLI